MSTDMSMPDTLPHELEPTGAAQAEACEWLLTIEPGYLRANCSRDVTPRHWMAGNWKHCPHCGKRLQIVEGAG